MQLKINTPPFKHLEIIATKINNNDDNIMLHIIDVTSWVKREQQLKGLSRAVEQSEEAVIITDRFGVIEYVNSSYEKSTGESSSEIIGINSKAIFKRYTDDTDKIDDIQSKLNQGQTIQRIISQKIMILYIILIIPFHLFAIKMTGSVIIYQPVKTLLIVSIMKMNYITLLIMIN